MLAGYQVNKVDFLNLVRARLNEFNTDIQYWHLYARAGQARARLAAASGREVRLAVGDTEKAIMLETLR